jgi:hypothetical protein
MAAGNRRRQSIAASTVIHSPKGKFMTSLAISSPTTAALPTPNIHPHGHGHKRGSEVDSLTDPSDSTTTTTAAQSPTASTQNPFDSLLTSLEQVIGIQPTNQAPSGQSTQSSHGAQPVRSAQPTLVQAAQQAIGSKLNLIV